MVQGIYTKSMKDAELMMASCVALLPMFVLRDTNAA